MVAFKEDYVFTLFMELSVWEACWFCGWEVFRACSFAADPSIEDTVGENLKADHPSIKHAHPGLGLQGLGILGL